MRLFAELGSTMKLPRSGRGRLVARGPGAGRPRAAADDPHPRVPREAAAPRRRRRRAARLTMRRGRQLRVLIAPDSFKGSLTSVEVARALADGWHRARPGDDAPPRPARRRRRGDAGRDRGRRRLAVARGRRAPIPLGRPIRARWLRARRRPGRGRRDGRRRPACRSSPPAERDAAPRHERRDRRRAARRARRGDPRHRARASAAARRPTAAPGCSGRWAPTVSDDLATVDLGGLDPRLRRDPAADRLRRDQPAARADAAPPRSTARRRARRPSEVVALDARCARFADALERATGRRERDTPGRRGGGRRRVRDAVARGPVRRAASCEPGHRPRHGGGRLRPRPGGGASS